MNDDLHYGCMVFDDPCEHAAGWAAQEGEQATRRAGTANLATDTIWLTNLDYAATRIAGFSNHVRFQRADYLREPLWQIAARYGIKSGWNLATFGAAIFDRTMRLAMHILRMRHIPRFALKNGIREVIAGKDPLFPEEAHSAITEAISYNTNCERVYRTSRDEEDIRFFKIPYREHAITVLETPLPAGEMTKCTGALPRGNEEVRDWLESIGRPALIKITADNFDPQFNKLLNFGSSPATSQSNRRWVTNQELLCLATFAELKVIDAFISKDIFVYSYLLDILYKLPKSADMSVSAGLFFENLWTAASTSLPNKTAETHLMKSINAHTPFLRAMDRINCMAAAKRLEAAGLEIAGYATGSIRANCYGKNSKEIVAAAIEADLIPPACDLEKSEYPKEINMHEPTPLQMMQLMCGCGLIDRLLSTDKLIIEKILNG